MPRGGARNRSGPQADPNSGRSDRRGLSPAKLPAEGYEGTVPEWPLSHAEELAEREGQLWAWAWRLPQAAAWAREPWRWHAVAMWVRTAVVCEGVKAQAADKNSLHRLADQIGLTPAGLRENGWAIAADEMAEKRDEPKRQGRDLKSRLTVVADGAGG